MKKILLIIAVITILSGCGTNDRLTCSVDNTVNNITSKTNYVIDYKDNDIKMIRLTYDYKSNNNTDGVGTGTDGTTNDTQKDKDGIIDGVIGNGIDAIVGSVTDVILDLSGLKERHANVQGTYGNMTGFSVQNTTDTDNNYKVTYVIDFDTISDDDLKKLNLSRDIDTLKNNYISQGYTCK